MFCAVRDNILSEDDDVSRRPPIDNFDVRQALDIGESFYDNVTRSVGRDTRPVRKGTPQARHTAFQRARDGVTELNEVALVAMEASRNLDEPSEQLSPGVPNLFCLCHFYQIRALRTACSSKLWRANEICLAYLWWYTYHTLGTTGLNKRVQSCSGMRQHLKFL